MHKYKKSRYNVWLDSDLVGNGGKLCFNAIGSGFAELDKSAINLIDKVTSDDFVQEDLSEDERVDFGELLLGKIICPTQLDELEYLEYSYLSSSFGEHDFGMTICPTMNCNFRCSYCFEEHSNERMSNDVVNQMVNYVEGIFKRKNPKTLHVGWFGGEPLLEFSVIENLTNQLYNMSNKYSARYSSSMITNAWHLTENIASRLPELKITQLQITLDGIRKIHNQKRKLVSGAGTYDRIVSNIINASKYCNIAVRVNMDKQNFEMIDRLLDSILEIHNKCNDYNNNEHRTSFYPGRLTSDCTEACRSAEYMTLSDKDYAEAQYKFLEGLYERNIPISWYSRYTSGNCTATRVNSVTVNPDGSLCKCWNQVGQSDEAYLKIDNMGSFKPENYYKWVTFNPFKIESCRNCKILPLCLGGCPQKRVDATTPFTKVTEGRSVCSMSEKTLKRNLELLFRERIRQSRSSNDSNRYERLIRYNISEENRSQS